LTIYRSDQRPVNNISLHDIEYASRSNNMIPFIDRLRGQLNDAGRKKQSLDLEAKLAQVIEKFPKAPDTLKAALLKDIDRELDLLDTATISTPQDPPEFKGQRIYGKGGPRKLTAAEIAEKELAKNDRQTKRSTNLQVVDLTTPRRTQPQSTPFIMTSSATGNVIRSPGRQPTLLLLLLLIITLAPGCDEHLHTG